MYLFYTVYGAVRNGFEAGKIHYEGHWRGGPWKSRHRNLIPMTLYLIILLWPSVLIFFDGYSKEGRFFEKGKGGDGTRFMKNTVMTCRLV
jgi:hypothetical protein